MARMIITEAATYAISGSVIGCMIGIPMHRITFVSLIANFWGIVWSEPVATVSLTVGIIMLSAFLAVCSPVKWIHEMSIVDTISAQ